MLFSLLINLNPIWNIIFIARGHAGCRRVRNEPTTSLLMTEMSQFKSSQLRKQYANTFCKSPLLCAYPPHVYAASAKHLGFSAVSISKRLLIMRRPLPISGTVLGFKVASQYTKGVFDKLLTLRNENISLYLRRFRLPQTINDGLTNFLWRGYEYEFLSPYIMAYQANNNAMNLAICLGFQIWYALYPNIMLALPYYDFSDILSPDKVLYIKNEISSWSQQMIDNKIDICENIRYWFTQPAALGMFEPASSSSSPEGVLNDTGIREPPGVESNHKVVLRRLVIACIATLILSSVSYTTVCGTELSKQILEG